MPRDRTDSASRSDYDSDENTDSECEYEMEVDQCSALARKFGVSERALADEWKAQSGFCRFSGCVLGTGDYAPVVVQRKFAESLSDNNFCIVIAKLAAMRAATGDNWRKFVRFMHSIGRDLEV